MKWKREQLGVQETWVSLGTAGSYSRVGLMGLPAGKPGEYWGCNNYLDDKHYFKLYGGHRGSVTAVIKYHTPALVFRCLTSLLKKGRRSE